MPANDSLITENTLVTPADFSLGDAKRAEDIPRELTLLPVDGMVVYPYTMVPINITDDDMAQVIHQALNTGARILGVVTMHEDHPEKVTGNDFYRTGTAVRITRMIKNPSGGMSLIIYGLEKIAIEKVTQSEPFFKGFCRVIDESSMSNQKSKLIEALTVNMHKLFGQIVSSFPYASEEMLAAVMTLEDPLRLTYLLSALMRMPLEKKQVLLESTSLKEKMETVIAFLKRESEVLALSQKIENQTKERLTKAQRDFFLREQLKSIQDELGDGEDEEKSEAAALRTKIEALELAEPVREKVMKDLSRIERLPPVSPEYPMLFNYIETVAELPWNTQTEDKLDIVRARGILDEDHYDLDEVKERILEFLSVKKLSQSRKGPILCFAGPPGVGKTSLGMSIARSMGREFIRISLGGMRDEAEIRGHRRTYIGALPGRIIQNLRRAETRNPVFMLDEIDKVGSDFRGDPSSALLEVLDPEQNHSFTDLFLGIPFDLSSVFFIATANVLETIHPALRDRMETIHISSYSTAEKIEIARRYLVKKQIDETGLKRKHLTITKPALTKIITSYTREAGVRNLDRAIAKVCRRTARRIVEEKKIKVTVKPDNLFEFLGTEIFHEETVARTVMPGVVTGLAWTSYGGDILFIESIVIPGKRDLFLTGQLGDVMQESARAGLSYIKAHAKDLNVDLGIFKDNEIHTHIPQGAVPKDGPSAGVSMAVAMVSALTGKKVRGTLAMTGEITLSGLVLPVGGIKEKVLAARRAGVNTIILPHENERDVDEITGELKQGLVFHFVKRLDEAFGIALSDGKAPVKKKRTRPKKKARHTSRKKK